MISNLKVKATYNGNGLTRTFPITFAFTDKNQIYAVLGEDTVIAQTDFTVDTGALTLTYPKFNEAPALAVGEMITIYRVTEKTQLADLTNQGGAWPETIEASLDKLTQITQEQEEALERCIKTTYVSETSPDELFERLKRGSEDAEMFARRAESASEKVEGAANTAAEALATSKELRDAVEAETKLLEYVKKVTDAINVAKIDFFEVDINGDIMPSEEPIYDVNYELDENGDIMPKE
ncbi:hypothetical protein TAMA11512_21320 [Selenomonas sp. TAMA-11512]|uniref:hypothetical protein n=1 Tax=Selenomonas sp. TAMA-11512 TaxID=3095337 RepID=UPI0030872DBF|nr:hypothetical protein TAMA11512_21320 [Selenomonas sp. TAMA-11512]